MQLTSIPSPTFDLPSTQRMFNDLAVELSRTDAKLEDNERESRIPTRGWDTTMQEYAARLDTARMQFIHVRPDAIDMAHALGEDTRHLSALGGKLEVYQNQRLGFGRGWGATLDRAINDVRLAASLLDTTPPAPPVTPPNPGNNGAVLQDATRAAKLVRQSLATIRQIPTEDAGTAATKDARLAAYNLNLDAQKLIEPHMQSHDPYVVSQLRSADASLEDASWQLAKKPSPDGRFNGVDIPGAQRDTEAAATTIENLIVALSGGA